MTILRFNVHTIIDDTKMQKRLILFYIFYLLLPYTAQAVKSTIEYRAERLEKSILNNKPCKKLAHNVVLTFHPSGMILEADTVYQYEENDIIEAHNNVKIKDNAGSTIQANKLVYYPEKKLAILAGDVIYKSDKATLYTPQLHYYIESKKASFSGGGRLLQAQMVVTSDQGTYDDSQHTITLSKEVILVDPSYQLHCDQLCYDTAKEEAYLQGFTKIIQDDSTLTSEKGGNYVIAKKQLILNQGTLTTQELTLIADRLEIGDGKDCIATGHTQLISKAHEATVIGESAKYIDKEKKIEMTGHPLLTKIIEQETMYLRADTFIALEKAGEQESDNPIQEIHALGHVRLYHASIQGLADGAIYTAQDKTIRLQNQPIIWCNHYQITGEDVYLVVGEKEKEEITLFVNSHLLMASADPIGNYNQIQGDKMIAYFKANAMEKIAITGNGECLYFILEDDKKLVGMNHIQCNSIELTMQENKLEKMECSPKPTGLFYPIELLKPEHRKLANFVWHGEKWPTKESILEAAVSPPSAPSLSSPP